MSPLLSTVIPPVKHALMRTISVVCVLLVIAGLGWAVYVTMIKPHTKPSPTTTENAQVINHYVYNPKIEKSFFLGVRLFGFELGLGK